MSRIEIYVIALGMLTIGATGGWFAGKSRVSETMFKDGIELKVETAMPSMKGGTK